MSHINSEVRRLLPGHGARILLWSFDFDEINSLIEQDDCDRAADKRNNQFQRHYAAQILIDVSIGE